MAVTLTSTDLATDFPDDFADATRAEDIANAAKRTVERYAPAAPDDIANEAFVRYALSLTEMGPFNRSSVVSGDIRVRFVTDYSGLFRRCGAAEMLSPYRVRRGLAPGGDDGD